MNQNSIDPAIHRQMCFQPPFCPNEKCLFHLSYPSEACKRKYSYQGWIKTLCYPYRVRRYRCVECKRGYRYSTFKLSYREQKPGLNSKIFRLFCTGASNREIGRQLQISEHTVRIRLVKLSQWAMLKHADLTRDLNINEPIVYDGLENFAKTQYDPNHIQHAIGKESLFIYDFSFAPLNRKGRMSPRQKRVRFHMESTVGRYDPKAIRKSTVGLIQRLYDRRSNESDPLILYSDEHFQYERAIKRDLKSCHILHVKISSLIPRNYRNHLFSVNHADLLTRQHVAAFKRETISFSKTHERMIQKYALFMAFKNYFRVKFVKPHKRDPECNEKTPAMHLGITNRSMQFHEFFDIKKTLTQVPLNQEWSHFYLERPTFTRNLQNVA